MTITEIFTPTVIFTWNLFAKWWWESHSHYLVFRLVDNNKVRFHVSFVFFLTGEESTLFVVLVIESFKLNSYSDDVEKFMKMIGECVRKTLSLIPGTKLVIANTLSCLAEKAELPCETLQVYAPKRIGLTTMLDLLKKRWKTLDLISVMQELKEHYAQREYLVNRRKEWNCGIGIYRLWKYKKTCLFFRGFRRLNRSRIKLIKWSSSWSKALMIFQCVESLFLD